MNVRFDEIGHLSATFIYESGEVGQVCKMTAAGTIGACEENDTFIGVIESIRGGYAVVQLEGFVTVTCAANLPALGLVNLYADGAGGVYPASNGHRCLCIARDTEAKTCTIKL